MEKHQTYFNLLDAVKENGCPICFLVKKSTDKFMDDFLYEQVNDPGMRKRIRKSLGFCNHHAWCLEKVGDGFGQSIIYRDLLEIFLDRIHEQKAVRFLKGTFENIQKICPLCEDTEEVEQRYISTFIENFNDPQLQIPFSNSFGLCLPHLNKLLCQCKDIKITHKIIEIETKKIEKLIEELKEYGRKKDYRFSKEQYGKEGDSWIRAIEKFTGKEGVF